MSSEWPPDEGTNLGRSIAERLTPIAHLTTVNGWFIYGDVAQIGIWPFTDEICATVSELLDPIQIELFAKPGKSALDQRCVD